MKTTTAWLFYLSSEEIVLDSTLVDWHNCLMNVTLLHPVYSCGIYFNSRVISCVILEQSCVYENLNVCENISRPLRFESVYDEDSAVNLKLADGVLIL